MPKDEKFKIERDSKSNTLFIRVHATALMALRKELAKLNKEEIIKAAKAMSDGNGVNIAALSRMFGCSYQNIEYVLKDANLFVSRKISTADGT